MKFQNPNIKFFLNGRTNAQMDKQTNKQTNGQAESNMGHTFSKGHKKNITIFHLLFVLMLNFPVNNFSVMLGQSHHFLGIISTFRGVNVFLLKDTTRWR